MLCDLHSKSPYLYIFNQIFAMLRCMHSTLYIYLLFIIISQERKDAIFLCNFLKCRIFPTREIKATESNLFVRSSHRDNTVEGVSRL
jgi:hypothetical protein